MDFRHWAETLVYEMQAEAEANYDTYSLVDRRVAIQEALELAYKLGKEENENLHKR